MMIRALTLVALLLAFAVEAPAQFIQSAATGPWSAPSTWTRPGGGPALPRAGDTVLIQAGHRVTLDTRKDIQGLAHLDVRGHFEVADRRDYLMRVSRIDVGRGGAMGATFEVGSFVRPFRHRFVLVLDDQHLSGAYGDPFEHLSFMVHPGAALEMHGRTVTPAGAEIASWLRLAEGHHLEKGATSMTLEADPHWRVGDRVVIASTDFDMNQAEVVQLKEVAGATVGFSPPLVFGHHAGVEHGVDERAEVGLLNRNIVVRSDSATLLRGGHVMAMQMGGVHGNLRLDGVEFRGMGWHGAHGRYPIHWHLCGTLPPGSNYVRNCSIHRASNRAITIHQTQGAEVLNNVAYDVIGHAFYLEDRVETDNRIIGNLGLVTKRPDPTGFVAQLGDVWPATGQPFFHASDKEVSTFWITHSQNTVVGNVAAGSAGHGIWYDPDPAANLQQIGVWLNNVAHSNGINGFHQEDARPFAYDVNAANPLDAVFEVRGLAAWKNRQAGIWNRCFGQALFVEAKLADNRIGVYFSSEGIQHDTAFEIGLGPVVQQLTLAETFSSQILRNSIVVGESANRGNPMTAVELGWPGGARSLPDAGQPQWELKGVEIYDGFIGIENTTFRNFRDVVLATPVVRGGETFALRPASALASRGERSTLIPGIPWGVDPRNMVSGLDIDDSVDHAMLFAIAHPPVPPLPGVVANAPAGADVHGANGIHATMIYDLDGSLGGAPNSYWINDNPLLVPNGAAPATLVGQHHLEPIEVQGPAAPHTGECYVQLMINFPNDASTKEITYIEFTAKDRGNGKLKVFDAHGSNINEPRHVFLTTLLADDPSSTQTFERYALSYPPGHQSQNDPRDMFIKLQFGENERHVMLEIPYQGGPPTNIICYPEIDPPRSLYAHPVTAPNLNAALPFFDDGQHDEFDYYYDAANQTLVLKPTIYDPDQSSVHKILDGRAMVMIIQG